MNLKINLICVNALVENSVDGNSYRNSDVIQTFKGKTVEIKNTDAEGRNILADALSWCQFNFKPQIIIDFATLTYAQQLSLGQGMAAIFGNDQALAKKLVSISKTTNDPIWYLPI